MTILGGRPKAAQNPAHQAHAASRTDSQETTRAPGKQRGYANVCEGVRDSAPPSSGEGGIRTLGTHKGTPVFETGPFDHSGTSPTRGKDLIISVRSRTRQGRQLANYKRIVACFMSKRVANGSWQHSMESWRRASATVAALILSPPTDVNILSATGKGPARHGKRSRYRTRTSHESMPSSRLCVRFGVSVVSHKGAKPLRELIFNISLLSCHKLCFMLSIC